MYSAKRKGKIKKMTNTYPLEIVCMIVCINTLFFCFILKLIVRFYSLELLVMTYSTQKRGCTSEKD